MKKAALLVLFLAALGGLASPVLAGSFTTGANGAVTFTGTISPSVTAVLTANPNNPQALAAAIQALLESDASLADDVIELANTQTNTSTANAIATGYGQAVSELSGTNAATASALRTASIHFSAGLLATYSAVASAAPSNNVPSNGNTTTGSTIIVPGPVSPR